MGGRTLNLENCCYQCIEGCNYRICGHCYLMQRGNAALWTEKTESCNLPLAIRVNYWNISLLGLALQPDDFLECDRVLQCANTSTLCTQELNRRRFERAQMQGLASVEDFIGRDPVLSKRLLSYGHMWMMKRKRIMFCMGKEKQERVKAKLYQGDLREQDLASMLHEPDFKPLNVAQFGTRHLFVHTHSERMTHDRALLVQ